MKSRAELSKRCTSQRRRRVASTFALVAAFLVLLPVASASAEPKMATVAIDVIRASKKEGKTDPRLEKFRVHLSDFAYKSYELVATRLVTVEEKKSTSVQLEGDKKLRVTFSEIQPNGRARLELSIPDVVESTVALGHDGVVVLGGPGLPSEKGGVLFVPVTLVRAK